MRAIKSVVKNKSDSREFRFKNNFNELCWNFFFFYFKDKLSDNILHCNEIFQIRFVLVFIIDPMV